MNKEEFETLNPSQKQNLMLKISAAHPQFKFLNLTTFRCGGDSFETGVFDFKRSEFVFIPSDEPVLGWDDFAVLDEISAAKIKEQCEFCGSEQSLREYVAQQTSPLRRAKIPAMLAERKASEFSWFEVGADDARLKAYERDIERFLRGEYKSSSVLILSGTLKLVREEGEAIIADVARRPRPSPCPRACRWAPMRWAWPWRSRRRWSPPSYRSKRRGRGWRWPTLRRRERCGGCSGMSWA